MAEKKIITSEKNIITPEEFFNPYDEIDSVIDSIEKDYGLTSSSLDKNEKRVSTGLLVLDLITGKGIAGGGWYTLYGGESSAKSTTAATIIANSVNSEVPVVQLWDYEGCFTEDTLIRIDGKDERFGDYVNVESLVKGFNKDIKITVDTLGGQAKACVYYAGEKDCTIISWEGGEFEGANHPIMVLGSDGNLEWKKIEQIVEGDIVYMVE